MTSKVAKKAPRKRGAKAYKFPETIEIGEVLTDLSKKQWILGKPIGRGGFGEIYAAASYSGKTPKEYTHVIKIEPHENGPLFVEMHFYMKNAKPIEIESWKKKKKLQFLGMPKYIGSGSHEYKNAKYRFIVMDRYGTDLAKLFEQNNKRFPEHTVYKIALQLINILEYIHHKTYVHADIKGANLLLDLKSKDRVYLVDFGLASHYTTKDEYKLDPRKAHNGTIEYTSRDAHMGVPTMRSDFEVLCYNIIHWLCGSLLWDQKLSDPVVVQKEKEKAFEDISEFLHKSFNGSVPNTVLKFMNLTASMKFKDTPDYDKFRNILTNGLTQLSHEPDGELEFKSDSNSHNPSAVESPLVKVKRTIQRAKRSPRIKALKSISPIKSLDDSNVGIILDKKRGGANDIKKVLNNIESDEEYDIKIVKKSKNSAHSTRTNKSKNERTPIKSRKKINVNHHNDAVSDTEPEVISRGTKSRPAVTRNVTSKNKKTSPKTHAVGDSTSDEDMFNM